MFKQVTKNGWLIADQKNNLKYLFSEFQRETKY